MHLVQSRQSENDEMEERAWRDRLSKLLLTPDEISEILSFRRGEKVANAWPDDLMTYTQDRVKIRKTVQDDPLMMLLAEWMLSGKPAKFYRSSQEQALHIGAWEVRRDMLKLVKQRNRIIWMLGFTCVVLCAVNGYLTWFIETYYA